MDPDRFVLLVLAGLAIGAFGTLIGSGGGFLLVTLLILLYPNESTGTITSISLAVVFVNAFSGTLAYSRAGRIDYRRGVLFSAAAVPGAIVGAMVARGVDRSVFDVLFGLVLIALAVYLMVGSPPPQEDRDRPFAPKPNAVRLGALLSVGVGFLSSFFGIGGGVMHVPMMARLLAYPVRIATATSQLILAVMSFAGTVVHVLMGEFQTGWRRTAALSIGVFIGAQLGAALSRRVGGRTIQRLLAAALIVVGLRLAVGALLP